MSINSSLSAQVRNNLFDIAHDAVREFTIPLPQEYQADQQNDLVLFVKEHLQFLKSNPAACENKVRRIDGYLLRLNAPQAEVPTAKWAAALTGLIGSYAALEDVVENMRAVSEHFDHPINAIDSAQSCTGREMQVLEETLTNWLKKPTEPLFLPPLLGITDLRPISDRDIIGGVTAEQLKVIIRALVASCPNLEYFGVTRATYRNHPLNITAEAIELLAPLEHLHTLEFSLNILPEHLPALATLERVHNLTLKNCPELNDDCLKTIAETMKHLRRLHLGQSDGFTDSGLCHLIGMELDFLKVERCSRTALQHISQMTSLQELDLGGWNVENGDGFELLANLVNLKTLQIYCSKLNDLGFVATLTNLTHFWCHSYAVVDASLHGFHDLAKKGSKLEVLRLADTAIGDEGLQFIKDLTSLKTLSLPRSISGRGLATISGLTNLEELNVDNTNGDEIGRVTNEGLQSLTGMTKMRKLSFDRQNISDDGFAAFATMPELQSLRLPHCKRVTGAGFEHLNELKKLEELDLGHCKELIGASFIHISELRAMKRMNLNFCTRVGDAGLHHLSGMTEMQELQLLYCSLTDQSAAALAPLTKLKKLELDGNKITPQGVRHLRPLKALEELSLNAESPVTDEFLQDLAELYSLKKFQFHGLYHRSGRDPVWAPLKQKLPKLRIH